MSGRDEGFTDLQRLQARDRAEFARAIEKARDQPDEVLELHNFAVGAGLLAGESGRQAIRFIVPNGRQVIAKMTHENARGLAEAIEKNIELDAIPEEGA
jgi:hypothetical protein